MLPNHQPLKRSLIQLNQSRCVKISAFLQFYGEETWIIHAVSTFGEFPQLLREMNRICGCLNFSAQLDFRVRLILHVLWLSPSSSFSPLVSLPGISRSGAFGKSNLLLLILVSCLSIGFAFATCFVFVDAYGWNMSSALLKQNPKEGNKNFHDIHMA